MQHKNVQKCDCCDNLVSAIRIAPSPIRFRKSLYSLMQQELLKLGMQGDLSLAHTKGLIVAFNYTYKNAAEIVRSEEVCKALAKVASDFYSELIKSQSLNYYCG